jgi:hypothetical protein
MRGLIPDKLDSPRHNALRRSHFNWLAYPGSAQYGKYCQLNSNICTKIPTLAC